MSNTVFTVIDDGSDKDAELKLVGRLSDTNPPVGPYTLIWRAYTAGAQRWTSNLVEHVLTYDHDTKVFSLTLNNLVA